MFIERLSKEKFENLLQELLYAFKYDTLKLESYKIQNNNTYFYYNIINSTTKNAKLKITLNDASANVLHYALNAGLPAYSYNYKVSNILQDFLLKEFGLEYFEYLKDHFTKQKNTEINNAKTNYQKEMEKLEKTLNKKIEEIEKTFDKKINDYTNKFIKQEIKQSNNIEEILKNFEKDLERFATIEEKVEYLKSFGFDVKVKKDDENLEK